MELPDLTRSRYFSPESSRPSLKKSEFDLTCEKISPVESNAIVQIITENFAGRLNVDLIRTFFVKPFKKIPRSVEITMSFEIKSPLIP
jgi:hypothetical protein